MSFVSPPGIDILFSMEGKKILVVEDDRSLARLMEIMLGGRGARVVLCHAPFSAVNLARRLRPDLVILDIHLPRFSGLWVLKKLRQEEETREIPVLVSSVLSDEKRIRQLEEMGRTHFVPKSKGIGALLEKVEELLEGRPRERGRPGE